MSSLASSERVYLFTTSEVIFDVSMKGTKSRRFATTSILNSFNVLAQRETLGGLRRSPWLLIQDVLMPNRVVIHHNDDGDGSCVLMIDLFVSRRS